MIGTFVSLFRQGGRYIYGTGYLEATGASSAAASKALKLALRTVQAQNGTVVGTFADTDAETYTNCVLVRYQPAARIVGSVSGGTFTARCRVAYTILESVPS